jgi:hypothetical protein
MSNEKPEQIGGDFLHQPGTPPLTQAQADLIARDMRIAGLGEDVIQNQLKAQGYEAREPSAAETASANLTALKNDPKWVERVLAGDADANAELDRLAYVASHPDAQRRDDPWIEPEAYSLPLRHPVIDAQPELAERFQVETRQWAAELQLPVNVASAISEHMLDNVAKTTGMGLSERENHGHGQEALLRSVLSRHGDPDATIKEAARVLKLQSGRDFNLVGIARECGANVAHEMILHAQTLSRRR